MTLTDEQLSEIENFGYVQFSIEQIAIVLAVNPKHLRDELTTSGSAGHNAYQKGRLMAEYDVRQQTFDLAKRGSLQAIIIAREYTNQLKIDEI